VQILSVAYPFAPVRPDTAGGAEQVLAMLDRALCKAGHRSTVLACEGSQVHGDLLALPRTPGRLDEAARTETHRVWRSAITDAVDRLKPDLVHLHGIDFPAYLPPPGVPVLATLHLPPAWYDPAIFKLDRPATWLNCVSHTQQNSCPATSNLVPFIANGVAEDLPRAGIRKCCFALGMGRICPEKGWHLAFEAARAAAVPFLLAGQVYPYPEHESYFATDILPRCNGQSRFIGTAGLNRKRRLLSSAKCMLIPSLAPETSSLAAMEAAMCGTPVVAFRSGALPEVVDDGVTGFLVDDEAGMANAIRRCDELKPEVCRNTALARFSANRMASEYLDLYQRLTA